MTGEEFERLIDRMRRLVDGDESEAAQRFRREIERIQRSHRFWDRALMIFVYCWWFAMFVFLTIGLILSWRAGQ